MKNIVISHNMRFTVIDPICVRIEYSLSGNFRDDPTLFAMNRNLGSEEFTMEDDGVFHLKTSALEIDWHYEFGLPKSGNLVIRQGDSVWLYGKKNTRNLGGPLPSLDGCTGPMPLPEGFLSRDGWQVIEDSSAAVLKNGWLTADPRGEDYLDLYYFAYGTEFKRALRLLTDLSGNVPMLPRWAMGSWYSRWFYYTSDDYRTILKEYEDHGYPLDVIVMDMEWHTRNASDGWGWGGTKGWTGWSWNRELLPDAEQLLSEFHQKNLRVAMNVHPHDGIRSHEDCYQDFMSDMGESTENGRYLEFDAGNRKYMECYFKHTHTPREKEGCDIWWVDWQQDCIYPEVKGLPGTPHLPWLNACYFNHMKQNGKRGIGFSRWGGFGDQKYPIHFSGDTEAEWSVLAFQVAFTALSGNSGCFFWTHDIGGFCGKRNPELYARWLQFGALSAALRLHSAGDDLDRRPWKWEQPFRNSMKKSFELRARLMPYLYSAMRDASRFSVPMLKPLYLEHPETESAYQNPQEFYLGEHFLSAPVTTPGTGKHFLSFQKIHFPEDGWCQFFTGETYRKGDYLVPAALEELPLFVRKGTAIPLGSPVKKQLAERDTEFELLLFPAESPCEHSFTLYDDDGISEPGSNTAFSEILIRTISAPGKVRIVLEEDGSAFAAERKFSLDLRNLESVTSFRINGVPADYTLKENSLISESVCLDRTLVFEAEFTVLPEQIVRDLAYRNRIAESLPQETRTLLEGRGVFPFQDPLSGTESLLVFPEGIQAFQMKQNGSVLEGTLEGKGNDPVEFSRSGAMEFHYSDGAIFRF